MCVIACFQFQRLISILVRFRHHTCTDGAENSHRWGKHHCMAGLQINKTRTDQ